MTNAKQLNQGIHRIEGLLSPIETFLELHMSPTLSGSDKQALLDIAKTNLNLIFGELNQLNAKLTDDTATQHSPSNTSTKSMMAS